VVQLDNVAIRSDGALVFYNTSHTRAEIEHAVQPYALRSAGGAVDKPALHIELLNSDMMTEQQQQCSQLHDADTVAFIWSPWHPDNAFHLLNDNLLSLFANVVHSLSSSSSGSTQKKQRRILYVWTHDKSYFNRAKFPAAYQLIWQLFDKVLSYEETLLKSSGVTTCFRSLRYGRGPLLFYHRSIDSSSSWNRVGQDFARWAHHVAVIKQTTSTFAFSSASTSTSSISRRSAIIRSGGAVEPRPRDNTIMPRVTIMLRGAGDYRRVTPSSWAAIKRAFVAAGVTQIADCCDWQRTSLRDTVLQFPNATDLLIGVHGAGLAHGAFMRPGSMLVEIQGPWGVGGGGQHFYQLSQLFNHTYLLVDGRVGAGATYSKRTGHVFDDVFATNFVQAVLYSWFRSHTYANLLRLAGRTAIAQALDVLPAMPDDFQSRLELPTDASLLHCDAWQQYPAGYSECRRKT
jgi:hypothetical protein